MKNLWFLRTDMDNFPADIDLSEENPFIYSAHGSCGKQKSREIQQYKEKIFPNLTLTSKELRRLVHQIKINFIDTGVIDGNELGKTQCDLFISYWIATMKAGDLVLVRNKKQEVFICEVSGYVSEQFFEKFGSFQRPVRILEKIPNDAHERASALKSIWHRTRGRRTIERNRKPEAINLIMRHLNANLPSRQLDHNIFPFQSSKTQPLAPCANITRNTSSET